MLARFARDERGFAMLLFAIALIPLIGFMGVAVDYSRASRQKARLQLSLDSAAIAIAKMPPMTPLQDLQQSAEDVFNANFGTKGELRNIQLNVVDNNDTLSLSASGIMDNVFMQVLGTKFEKVATSATVARPFRRKLELALVLDNTGSMADNNKLTELQKAVKLLLDILKPTVVEPDDIKISIVPFARFVKLPSGVLQNTDFEKKPPNNWSGCVTDRNQPNDTTDIAPQAGTTNTLYWWRTSTSTNTPVDCGNLTTILPLTTNFDTLYAKADQMVAAGNTNLTIGIEWGWHSLTPGLPLTGGSAPGTKDIEQVMVVLTDGDNTQNRWSTSSSSIDLRTEAVCSNVKLASVLVYTIRVIDGNRTLLQDCASYPSTYYEVTQASQLSAVFSQIANNLAQLRLTK